MLKICKTTIFLTRGDSAYIEININKPCRTPYILQQGDSVQCQIRTEANIGKLLVDASLQNKKIYLNENGVIVWHIIPDDTKNLEIGTYSYDVQLVTAEGDVFTFIEDAEFNVTNEVTWNED